MSDPRGPFLVIQDGRDFLVVAPPDPPKFKFPHVWARCPHPYIATVLCRRATEARDNAHDAECGAVNNREDVPR